MKQNAEKISVEDLKAAGIDRAVYKVFSERASLNKGAFGLTSDWAMATNSGIEEARKELEKLDAKIAAAKEQKDNQTIIGNDFTIKTNPKDTLVMAGGTKFGEETNALLKELITAVKAGGNVYMDGNKVGQALVLSTTKLS